MTWILIGEAAKFNPRGGSFYPDFHWLRRLGERRTIADGCLVHQLLHLGYPLRETPSQIIGFRRIFAQVVQFDPDRGLLVHDQLPLALMQAAATPVGTHGVERSRRQGLLLEQVSRQEDVRIATMKQLAVRISWRRMEDG